jgi:hypothetical protein
MTSVANFINHLRNLLRIAGKQLSIIFSFAVILLMGSVAFANPATASTVHDAYSLTSSTHFYANGSSRGITTSPEGKKLARKNITPARRGKKLLLADASMPQLVARIEDRAQNHLSPAGMQVLNAINAVRKQFGLAPGLPTTAGRGLVIQGARTGNDPNMLRVGSSIPEEYSIWGAVSGVGAPSVAATSAVVNAWVYKDGWMGSATENLDCTSPTAPGCNGHRRAVLSTPPVPGATLYINAVSIKSTVNGSPVVSMAALLIWVAP